MYRKKERKVKNYKLPQNYSFRVCLLYFSDMQVLIQSMDFIY